MTPREWRDVPGFPGYSVNDVGEILGRSGRVLTLQTQKSGHRYVQIRLSGADRPRKLWAHRAVLLAFRGEPLPGQESRHLNDAPSDNRLGNLVWGTHTDNAADRRRNGGYQRDHWSATAVLSNDQVAEIIRSPRSSRTLGAQYGVSHTTVLELKRQARKAVVN